MFHLQYLHANYLKPHWTWNPIVQYPHTNFKHTLDLGPDLAILASKTKTHSLVGILSFATNRYMQLYTTRCHLQLDLLCLQL
jgi:hypothetical protein